MRLPPAIAKFTAPPRGLERLTPAPTWLALFCLGGGFAVALAQDRMDLQQLAGRL